MGTADGTYAALDELLDDIPRMVKRLTATIAVEPSAAAPVGSKPRVTISGRTVLAGSLVAAGLAGGAAGTMLLLSAARYFSGPVTEAFDLYMAEPQGSSTFSQLYDAYLREFAVFRWRKIAGAAACAGGAAAAAGAVVLLIAPSGRARTRSVAFVAAPTPKGLRMGVRVGW